MSTTTSKNIKADLQRQNKSNIYNQFLYYGSQTKQEIVSALNLCLPTVTKNIDILINEGLLDKTGSQGNTGGRRATMYSIIKDARISIGADITRNHLSIVMLDLTGNILCSIRHRIKFEPDDQYYQYLGSSINNMIINAKVRSDQILGVGIGLPALVDEDRKSVFFSKIIDLSGTIIENLSKYIPYKIQLFNDANAAAFTETWMNHDIKNTFYLMLSNNIGGSMVIDNEVYTGDTQRSGEAGHITLVHNGKPCYCGQRGCVDCYLAATVLSDMSGGNLEAFFKRLADGEESYAEKWNEYLDYLASTVNIIHVLLDCPIILGGYVGEYINPYIDVLKNKATAINTFENNADYLKICSYKKESIAAGSGLNFISDFLKSV